MSDRVVSAMLAVALGLALAVVSFVPFAVLSYRRRGAMTVGRTLTWVAGLVYAMALWTFTLLPFPQPDNLRCQSRNLRPFEFVHDIRKFAHGSARELASNPALLQFAYNVVLFLPLGFVLRLLWRRGWVASTVAGLGVSAVIEFTQLTGVWGLYSCAYRTFDVDDLMANTFGGLLGGLLSLPLARAVAFDDPVDRSALAPKVTRGRRVVGMMCDWLGVHVVWLAAVAAVQVTLATLGRPYLTWVGWLAVVPFAIGLVMALATGRTFGDQAVGIRFTRPDADRWDRVLRYLGGIGGYTALSPVRPLAFAFVAVTLVALLAVKDHAGLAGWLSRQKPVVPGDRPARADAGLPPAGDV